VEGRCKVLEEKYERVKDYKRIMKSCLLMQCIACSKWIQTHLFSGHIEQCCGSVAQQSIREKTGNDFSRDTLHIAVSQTVIK
jgi:hypothetical protein